MMKQMKRKLYKFIALLLVVCLFPFSEITVYGNGEENVAIEPGDDVYAKDIETGEEGYKEVVRLFVSQKDILVHITIGDVQIDTTTEHPFWVDDKGFVEAQELSVGDEVLTVDGELKAITATTTEKLDSPVTVYNFEVKDWHTYYVSEEEILVHNQCEILNKAKLLQQGGNGTVVDVKNKVDADLLLKTAFPDYQKVKGIGSQDAKGIRKKYKMQRYKQGGAYHKDYAIDSSTGRVYGHEVGNPHGMYPHINIKRTDGKTVMINIVGGIDNVR